MEIDLKGIFGLTVPKMEVFKISIIRDEETKNVLFIEERDMYDILLTKSEFTYIDGKISRIIDTEISTGETIFECDYEYDKENVIRSINKKFRNGDLYITKVMFLNNSIEFVEYKDDMVISKIRYESVIDYIKNRRFCKCIKDDSDIMYETSSFYVYEKNRYDDNGNLEESFYDSIDKYCFNSLSEYKCVIEGLGNLQISGSCRYNDVTYICTYKTLEGSEINVPINVLNKKYLHSYSYIGADDVYGLPQIIFNSNIPKQVATIINDNVPIIFRERNNLIYLGTGLKSGHCMKYIIVGDRRSESIKLIRNRNGYNFEYNNIIGTGGIKHILTYTGLLTKEFKIRSIIDRKLIIDNSYMRLANRVEITEDDNGVFILIKDEKCVSDNESLYNNNLANAVLAYGITRKPGVDVFDILLKANYKSFKNVNKNIYQYAQIAKEKLKYIDSIIWGEKHE